MPKHAKYRKPSVVANAGSDWRCRRCFKLLGRREERRVHVQFARGHRYIVSAPVSAVCRSCGTLNELL